jgi:hypothetical protein
MGEHPGAATLAGGSIVLAAVFANEAFGAWRTRAPRAGRNAGPGTGLRYDAHELPPVPRR